MSQEQLCAKITTNNLVEQVIVCDSVEWCQTSLGGTWIKVSDSTGKCGIGSVYKSDVNKFHDRQPYPSWALDSNLIWQPPVAMPTDDKQYIWNETDQTWDEIVVDPSSNPV